MIARVSCNPARNSYSETFWYNAEWPLQKLIPGSMLQNNKKAESNSKIANHPENYSPNVILRNQLRHFRAIPPTIILNSFSRAMFSEWVLKAGCANVGVLGGR